MAVVLTIALLGVGGALLGTASATVYPPCASGPGLTLSSSSFTAGASITFTANWSTAYESSIYVQVNFGNTSGNVTEGPLYAINSASAGSHPYTITPPAGFTYAVAIFTGDLVACKPAYSPQKAMTVTPSMTVKGPSSVNTGTAYTYQPSGLDQGFPYTYAWSGSCSGTAATCSETFPSPGTYTVTLTATDNVGVASSPSSVTVHAIASPISVSITPAENPTDVGMSTGFTGTATVQSSAPSAGANGSSTITTSTNTSSVTLSSVTASSGIFVAITYSYSASITVNVHDSDGNSFTVYQNPNGPNSAPGIQWFAWTSGAHTTNGADVVTTYFSTNPAAGAASTAVEVKVPSGGGSVALDSYNFGGAHASLSSLTVSTGLGANDLLLDSLVWGSSISSPAVATSGVSYSALTLISQPTGFKMESWYGQDPGSGSTSAAYTWSGSDQAGGVIVGIKSGQAASLSYTWKIGGSQVSTASNFFYAFGSSGTYTVNLTVNNSVGGHGYSQLTEVVNPALVVSAVSNVSAADVSYPVLLTAVASSGSPGYAYSWVLNSNQISTAVSFVYTFTSAGSYTVSVTATDQAGASQTASVTVTVHASPSATVSPSANPADVGYAVTFGSTVTGGTGTITYSWTVGGTVEGTGSTLTYSFGGTGSYPVAVTVSDADKQTYVASVSETIVSNPGVTVAASPSPTTVNVLVTVTATVTAGSSPFTYSWTINGGGTSYTTSSWSQPFSSGGMYAVTVTVTDADGHQATNTVDVQVNSAVVVSLSSSQNPTDVGNTVTYTASASGGTAPYASYTWTDNGVAISGCSATSSTCALAMNTQGSFSIEAVVTDQVGASNSFTLTETVNTAPGVTVTSSQNPTDVGLASTFTAPTTGGTGTYTFTWTVNSAQQASTTSQMVYTFTSAGSATVAVTAKDANGNTASDSLSETVNSDPTATISPSANPTDASASVTFTANPSLGTGSYTYAWTINGGAEGSASTLTLTFGSPGTDSVGLTVTDAAGKATTAALTETVNANPSVSLSAQYSPVDVHVADLLTATPSGGSGTLHYSWYVDGSAVLTGGTTPTYTWTPASTGSYTLQVEVTDSMGLSAYSSSSYSVVAQADPSVTISGPIAVDVSIQATWTGSAQYGTTPYTYAWTVNGASVGSAVSLAYTFSPAGSYTLNLTATDAQGAKAYRQETVTASAQPTVTIAGSPTTVDVGYSVSFTSTVAAGTGPFTYNWVVDGGSDGSASSLAWASSSAGSHMIELQVTDSQGAHVTSNTVTVTVNTLPSASLSPHYTTVDVGVGDSVTATPSSGTPPYTYSWTVWPSAIGSVSGSGATVTFTASESGQAYVNVTVTDADSNTATASADITVAAAPTVTVTLNRTSVSVNVPVQFTATPSGGVGPFTYAWTKNGSSIGTANPLSYTFTVAGSFWVNVSATDSFGVAALRSSLVTVTGAPSATISSSGLATDVGKVISFSGSVEGGLAPYNYTWKVNSVLSGYGATFNHLFPATGSYTVMLVVKDAAGLTSSPSVAVTVNPTLTATMTAAYLSVDTDVSDTFNVTAANGTTPYAYGWVLRPGGTQASTSASLTASFGAPGTYLVNGTVTDAAGETVRITDSVVVATNVTSSISAAYPNVDVGVNDTLRPSVTGGVGPYTYSWLVSGDVYTTQYLTSAFSAPGLAPVQLTVADRFGHDAPSSLTVSVYADPTFLGGPVAPPAIASVATEYHARASGGYGAYTFRWTFGGGIQVGSAWANYTWELAGSNGYQLYFADQGGFNETVALNQYVQLDVSAVANVTRGPAPLMVTFSESVLGGSSYGYAWTFTNGQESAQPVISESFAAGNWTAELVVTSAGGAKGWANLTIVSLPAAATVSWTPTTGITVLTRVTLNATPDWVAVAPYSAAWKLPNGTVLNGLSVSTFFTTYAATQGIRLTFTYGPNSTVSVVTFTVSMVPATPLAKASGIETELIPGTLLSVSGAPSSSPDAAIAYYNWSLNGLAFHGVTQYFWFNATGAFALSLTVTDALGAYASEAWTVNVTSPGSNTSIVIVLSSTTSGQVTTYSVSVSTPAGVAATDAFLQGQLLSLTVVNETLVGSTVTEANYTFALNQGSYGVGTYTVKVVAWNAVGQSNSATTQFTDSVGTGGGGGLSFQSIVDAIGGPGWFWSIVIGIVSVVVAVAALTQRNRVDIDVAGVQLQGRKGKPLIIESTGRNKK